MRGRREQTRRRTMTAVVALAALLVAGACGGDDDAGGTTDAPDAATAADPVGTDPPAATTEPEAAPTATEGGSAASGSESAAAFPVTIEHKYGETTIPAQPERVVTVGFSDQDALLALGVVPVGIRDFYGEQPFATWPWAIDLLDGAAPEVLPSTALNYEQISALEPDLIVGISSGMTEEEYTTMSGIAPTLAQSGDFIDYGVPWQDATLVIGEATGHLPAAQGLVDDIEAQLADVAAEHPEWDGLEVAIGYVLSDTEIGAYASGDARPQLLAQLGFVTPPEFDELAGDLFYSSFSFEEMSRLDRDVLVWISGDADINAKIQANPLRQQLTAVAEGREIFLDQMQGGAFSFGSVLSIPYLLDTLVPQLVAAADGDPATAVPVP